MYTEESTDDELREIFELNSYTFQLSKKRKGYYEMRRTFKGLEKTSYSGVLLRRDIIQWANKMPKTVQLS